MLVCRIEVEEKVSETPNMVFKPYLVLKRTQLGKIKELHPEVGRWYAESVLDRLPTTREVCN